MKLISLAIGFHLMLLIADSRSYYARLTPLLDKTDCSNSSLGLPILVPIFVHMSHVSKSGDAEHGQYSALLSAC
jgi:hypothetical protein